MTPLEWVGLLFVFILWTILIDIRDWRRIEAKRAEAFRWAEANGGLSRAQLEAYQKTDGPTMSEIVAAREEEYENRRPLPPVTGCPSDHYPIWAPPPPGGTAAEMLAHHGLPPARDCDSAQAEADRLQIARLLEEVGGR